MAIWWVLGEFQFPIYTIEATYHFDTASPNGQHQVALPAPYQLRDFSEM